MTGTLYVCATPIGNLEDITLRVLRTLKEVDVIAAEDTRNSRKLLNHFGITTKMTSYHEHNRYDKGRELIGRLCGGESVALITDAGMPGISDPGETLVQMAYEAGVPVTVLPGACACVTALVLSGQPTGRFCFEAFLPVEKKEREAVFRELLEETRTIVIYEAPHRLKETLAELAERLGGERELSVLRELTKKHETVFRTTLREAAAYYEAQPAKGECVLVIRGCDPKKLREREISKWETLTLAEHVQYYEAQGMDKKEAMRAVAKDRNLSRRDVYQQLLEG